MRKAGDEVEAEPGFFDVERFPCSEDRRATNARLSAAGWDAVVAAAPGHVDTVRSHVLDPLTPVQVEQLRSIGDALLSRLDPDRRLSVLYDPDRDCLTAASASRGGAPLRRQLMVSRGSVTSSAE